MVQLRRLPRTRRPGNSAAFSRSGIVLAVLAGVCAASLGHQARPTENSLSKNQRMRRATTAARGGQPEFEMRCSGCHGLDGRGGEHAPNIATNSPTQHLQNSALFEIIHDGMPAKGMPGFGYLSNDTLDLVVSYVRHLGGQTGRIALQGNPSVGETLFFGKAECANCHMMHGQGGFLGPDLTEYAQTHTPRALKEAVLNPGQSRERGGEIVEILTRGGKRISGVIRNEDNFSLQFLGWDGAFHLLMKSEIERLDRRGGAIMPRDYGQRLSAGELEDLVSYLGQNVHYTTRKPSAPLRGRSPITRDVQDHRE